MKFYTNGIDEVFIDHFSKKNLCVDNCSKKKLTILYAGNIGSGQGLHKIIPNISARLSHEIEFKVIGDGGKKKELIQEINAKGITNIKIMDPVPQDQLVFEYMNADVLFLHLAKQPAFKNVIPSKLFEYAASGKPIWAGLSGFPAEFCLSEIENCVVFEVMDPGAAVSEFRKLKIHLSEREGFIKRYRRSRIAQEMAENIVSFIDAK